MSSMTRKHFIALAKAIKEAQGDTPLADLNRAVYGKAIASVCAKENPEFDRARFLAACGAT